MTSRVRRINRDLFRYLGALLILAALIWGVRSGLVASAGQAVARWWVAQIMPR